MKLHISLDLGRTVLNTGTSRISYGKNGVYPLMEGCGDVLRSWESAGHKLSVISKIDRGDEARITMSLVHAGLVPFLIDPQEVRFCYERSDKGPIAAMTKPDIHIDDRIEPMNAIHEAGVRWKILFIGLSDDRIEHGPLAFGPSEGLFVASTWHEVQQIVASLTSS